MQKTQKKKIMSKHGLHPQDTGSPAVQIALLTQRINEISKHLELHPNDNHTRKGLLKLVGARRRLLDYYKMKDKDAYEKLIKSLKLRK